MISKNKLKQISALSQKKMRDELGLFVAEGTKLVFDLKPTFQLETLVATDEWIAEYGNQLDSEILTISTVDLLKISSQKSPQGVLAVFSKPTFDYLQVDVSSSLVLALDDVQDPGNLGTIIRIADWFGIKDIFCSLHCADVYGHKTIQATMGALARVKVHYIDLEYFIAGANDTTPIYGTFMNGNDVFNENLTPHGIIVMGNEGNGISPKIGKLVTNRLLIPNFPKGETTSESLNVSVATALICGEFRRRFSQ